jgi:5-methylcytosine-specific restriction endonuclease McrA
MISEETRNKMRLSKLGIKRAPHSNEAKLKMSIASKGKKKSDSHRKNISLSKKGKKQSKDQVKNRTAKLIGKKRSDEFKKNISDKNKGKKRTDEQKLEMSRSRKGRVAWNKGIVGVYKMSLETKRRMSDVHKGEKAYNWKGGTNKVINKIRISFEYRLWRSDVFVRDNHTCQECGSKVSSNLNAHHLYPLSLIIKENNIKTFEDAKNCEKIWNINNGQTLCIECHKKTDSYLNKILKKFNSK